MKLPDANVFIYAANKAAREHPTAINWLKGAFEAAGGVGLSWVALLGFMRVSTRTGILAQPLTLNQALQALNFWLTQERARVVNPGERHAQLFGQLLARVGTGGNLTTDAHLAALAIEHGATLVSFDRDFARFDGLEFERLRA